jgi:hypothetical protein
MDDLVKEFMDTWDQKERLKGKTSDAAYTKASRYELQLLDLARDLWYAIGDEDYVEIVSHKDYATFCDGWLHYIVDYYDDECRAWYFCNCEE